VGSGTHDTIEIFDVIRRRQIFAGPDSPEAQALRSFVGFD